MIKKLTRRERRIFIACIAVLFVYAGYGAIYQPLMEQIDSVETDIITYQKSMDMNFGAITRAKITVQQNEKYVSRFKQGLTDEQVMTSMLSEIEEVSGELGLLISELKPNKVKHDEYYNKFSVRLTINSDMIEILRFLHTLQGQPHFFDVMEARFDKTSFRRSVTIKAHLVLSKILIP